MPDDEEPLNFEQEAAIYITAELMSRGMFVPVFTRIPRPGN